MWKRKLQSTGFQGGFLGSDVMMKEASVVAKMTLFRSLVAYLMASLCVVNGIALTTAEKVSGKAHFGPVLLQCKSIIVEDGLSQDIDPWAANQEMVVQ
jgi:hypothetical protein